MPILASAKRHLSLLDEAWANALEDQYRRLQASTARPWRLPSLFASSGLLLFSVTSLMPATERGSHLPQWVNVLWVAAGLGSAACFLYAQLRSKRRIPLPQLVSSGIGCCAGCNGPLSFVQADGPVQCIVCGDSIPNGPEAMEKAIRAAAEHLGVVVEATDVSILPVEPPGWLSKQERLRSFIDSIGTITPLIVFGAYVSLWVMPVVKVLAEPTPRGPTQNQWVWPTLFIGYGFIAAGMREALKRSREFRAELQAVVRPLRDPAYRPSPRESETATR